MATVLKIDQDAVTGKLLRIWIWADQNSVDGESLCITHAFIDRLADKKGFANAMLAAGWLIGSDGFLTFPNFDRHNGTTAKTRAETNRRVAKHRNKNNVTDVTLTPLEKPLPEKRREENIRGEGASPLSQDPSPPPDDVALREKINSLFDAWTEAPGFTLTERETLAANLEALASIPDAGWPLMARYVRARHPEGSAPWIPKSRTRFMESPIDLHKRAKDWDRKQPKPTLKLLPPPPATTDEPKLSREAISELFAAKEN